MGKSKKRRNSVKSSGIKKKTAHLRGKNKSGNTIIVGPGEFAKGINPNTGHGFAIINVTDSSERTLEVVHVAQTRFTAKQHRKEGQLIIRTDRLKEKLNSTILIPYYEDAVKIIFKKGKKIEKPYRKRVYEKDKHIDWLTSHIGNSLIDLLKIVS